MIIYTSVKEIIDSILADDTTIYMKNFLQVAFEAPDSGDRSALTRYNRRVLAYRAVLARASFDTPTNLQASTRGLFNQNLITAMQNSQSDNAPEYQSAARVFSDQNPTWGSTCKCP